MSYRVQRASRPGAGRSVLPTALGLVALCSVACGSSFNAADSVGGGGSAGTTGGSGSPSDSTGGTAGLGGRNAGGTTAPGGSGNEAGAPSGDSGDSAAGSTTGGAAGAAPEGGSGGVVVAGSGGSAAGSVGGVSGAPTGGSGGGGGAGAGGTGGVPACLDVQTSDANCGACGYACVNGRHCAAARCTPVWQPLSTENAPTARTRHAAAALGGKYVVVGGAPSGVGVGMSSAAEYAPATDTWSVLPSLNSARCSHEAVSTGSAILTFGGLSDCGNGTTTTPGLESFAPNASGGGSWSTISVSGEPAHRYAFAATWTGSALFVYGGGTNTLPAVSSGGLFIPSSAPAWSDASCALSGCERSGSYSFRDGNSMRVWGGGPFGNAPAGLSYDLGGQSWSAWTTPAGTADHLAQRFADDGRRIYFLTAANVVSVYDRKTSTWLANDTAPMPAGFCIEAAAAWTGSELVAWSGSCGGAPVSVGGRYQPAAPN